MKLNLALANRTLEDLKDKRDLCVLPHEQLDRQTYDILADALECALSIDYYRCTSCNEFAETSLCPDCREVVLTDEEALNRYIVERVNSFKKVA